MREKITTAMVEAGVNALAHTRKQSDEAVVAKVFQAMCRADHIDQIQKRRDAPAPYVHQAFPSWRYGPGGESKLCASDEDVPEGWASSPADVKAPPKAAPPKARAAA